MSFLASFVKASLFLVKPFHRIVGKHYWLSQVLQFPIQSAVLHRLGDVVGLDVFIAFDVGDGSGDAEDLVVRAGGEAHLGHGLFQNGLAGGVQLAELPHLARGHGGVGDCGVRRMDRGLVGIH